MPASLPPDPQLVVPIMAGIGNALLTVPMVRQLKAAFPAGRLTVLARSKVFGEIYSRQAEVDEVQITGTRPSVVLAAQREMRRRRPDVYVIPFPSNRWQYSMLAATGGGRRTVLHSYPTGRLRAMHLLRTRATLVPAERGLHDVAQNLNLLRPLGVEPDYDDSPVFPLTQADRDRADAMLRGIGIEDGVRPICLHAGCGRTVLASAKRWPPEDFGALIQNLEDRFGPRIVLMEGPDERGVAQEVLPHALPCRPRVLPLDGPLGDAAAVLERSDLYVGTDSGLAHLAAAVGTPPVTLFAPADPDRVCPVGYRHLVVQPTPPPRGSCCAPCLLYPMDSPYPKIRCREPMCITFIRREHILDAIDRAVGPPTRLPVIESRETVASS